GALRSVSNAPNRPSRLCWPTWPDDTKGKCDRRFSSAVPAAPDREEDGNTMTRNAMSGSDLTYSDGIAATRTMLALQGNAAALQRRLPSGWELAPYAGEDLRGTSLRGANTLVLFHEVYAIRTRDGQSAGLPQLSYIAFISQARNQAMGALAHLHWFLY